MSVQAPQTFDSATIATGVPSDQDFTALVEAIRWANSQIICQALLSRLEVLLRGLEFETASRSARSEYARKQMLEISAVVRQLAAHEAPEVLTRAILDDPKLVREALARVLRPHRRAGYRGR